MGSSGEVRDERLLASAGKQRGAILSGDQVLAAGVDDEMLRTKDSVELQQIHRKLMRSTGCIRFDGLFNLQCSCIYKQILAGGAQRDEHQDRDEGRQRENQDAEAPQEDFCVNGSHSPTSGPAVNMYPTPRTVRISARSPRSSFFLRWLICTSMERS